MARKKDGHKGLTLLGKQVSGTIGKDGLESFPKPDHVELVEFVTHEVTAFCPVTNQPDLYTVEITYAPRDICVESKSLKMYLNSFRDQGMFGEAIAGVIAEAINSALNPLFVTVVTKQQIRGGLQMTSTAEISTEV